VKVLVVSPLPLFPLSHGGRARIWHLAAGLARAGAAVDVLCPWTPGQPLRATERDGVRLHPQRFAVNALPAIAGDAVVPWQVALSLQPWQLGPRRRLRAFDGYDVAHFDFCAHAHWMGRGPRGAKVVYSSHNVERDFAAAQLGLGRWSRRMLAATESLERRAVRASDLVIATTDDDAGRFEELYGAMHRVEVLPQGHDAMAPDARERLRERTRRELGLRPGERAVLFFGGPAAHNREAVRFLETRVLPELEPGARLIVAGECAAAGNGNGRALRLGFVDDLRPLLAASDVGVNPVESGCGQSLKVAQYLGAGLPVVATPSGARGEQMASSGVHIAPRAEFAAAVAAITRAPRPPVQGDATSWTAIGARLHRIYEELLDA
jgi:glycosyltransferase involved in cell wall biosynthesis